jgi:hypothetical protein
MNLDSRFRVCSHRAGFRYGQEGQLPRAPTKRGPPQIRGPVQERTLTSGPPDKRASTQWELVSMKKIDASPHISLIF